ncbi:manganese efflux pump MntP family protein [Veillonella intestinalis]|uniref:manganese efflux pump MntP n=1 Tax=Veillonella intestinalis TaxID=2941341 RepID=UPI00203BE891|nr:manganese efflux pump MntP family protein [Veillonella intestinalis]
MSIWELSLIAISLAMDAFAVAVAKGPCMSDREIVKKIGMPFLFGVFQMLMPIIGWFIGAQLASKIDAYDHWIIFGLLAYLGINMIRNSKKVEYGEDELIICQLLTWREVFVLAIATSIDALAIGLTLAFFDINILAATGLIGIVAFILSLAGVYLGQQLKKIFAGKAEVVGGVVLVLIGLKILLQHLQII